MAFWKPSRSEHEPVEPSPPAPVVRQGMTQAAPRKALKPGPPLLDGASDEATAPKKGFDPYNSGAFNFKDTWARVDRKK
jgi:hypothetical protein